RGRPETGPSGGTRRGGSAGAEGRGGPGTAGGGGAGRGGCAGRARSMPDGGSGGSIDGSIGGRRAVSDSGGSGGGQAPRTTLFRRCSSLSERCAPLSRRDRDRELRSAIERSQGARGSGGPDSCSSSTDTWPLLVSHRILRRDRHGRDPGAAS